MIYQYITSHIFVLIYRYFLSDGIVAINKPYGIPIYNKAGNADSSLKICHKIVGAVDYSINDALPYLAKELDVPVLIPCMGSEKCVNI